MTAPFQQAFERTIGFEGGYANDPRDPGGETKYGISKRAYPALDGCLSPGLLDADPG